LRKLIKPTENNPSDTNGSTTQKQNTASQNASVIMSEQSPHITVTVRIIKPINDIMNVTTACSASSGRIDAIGERRSGRNRVLNNNLIEKKFTEKKTTFL
jgi:hypothetical protein